MWNAHVAVGKGDKLSYRRAVDFRNHYFRQYAHFVLATIQFMKCIALFVAPAMVAYFVEDERRHDQWRYVHWINGAMLIFVGFTSFFFDNGKLHIIGFARSSLITPMFWENYSDR